jgi:hypothetical protein
MDCRISYGRTWTEKLEAWGHPWHRWENRYLALVCSSARNAQSVRTTQAMPQAVAVPAITTLGYTGMLTGRFGFASVSRQRVGCIGANSSAISLY